MKISKQIIIALHEYRKRNNRKPNEIRINNELLDSLVSEFEAMSYVEIQTLEENYSFCGIKLIPDNKAKGIELIAKERFEVFSDEL